MGLRAEYDDIRQRYFSKMSPRVRQPDEPPEIEQARQRLTEIRSKRDAFNIDLRRAMRQETEQFCRHIFREDRSLLDLVDCNYSFLNERLAKHYGIDGVTGDELRRVELPPGSHRGGLLTQGAFLVVTSNPTRTSPVKRGLFILDNLLAAPAPPPPPDVPQLEDSQKRITDRQPTLREALELHRAQPLCNSCHARFDPLGLALENYNALGQWRDSEAGQPIDASGRLITGEEFQSIDELKAILRDARRLDVYRCLSERMLTYALGRGMTPEDEETLEVLVNRLEAAGGRSSVLISGIVQSAAFQKIRPASADHDNKTGGTPVPRGTE